MKRISRDHLRTLRNDVDVLNVIDDLGIPTEFRGARKTFRCPQCREFHTAFNGRDNLARCFRCQESFNAIDIVMAERSWSFLETVRYLDTFLGLSG